MQVMVADVGRSVYLHDRPRRAFGSTDQCTAGGTVQLDD